MLQHNYDSQQDKLFQNWPQPHIIHSYFIWDHIDWKYGPSKAAQLPLQSYLMPLENT